MYWITWIKKGKRSAIIKTQRKMVPLHCYCRAVIQQRGSTILAVFGLICLGLCHCAASAGSCSGLFLDSLLNVGRPAALSPSSTGTTGLRLLINIIWRLSNIRYALMVKAWQFSFGSGSRPSPHPTRSFIMKHNWKSVLKGFYVVLMLQTLNTWEKSRTRTRQQINAVYPQPVSHTE